MTDTKELLERIAALRRRLETIRVPAPSLEDTVAQGALQTTLVDKALCAADMGVAPDVPAPARLTARGAQLLRRGRERLQELRTIAGDPEYQRARENDAVANWHREGTDLLEMVMRTVPTLPESVRAQLRICNGLEVVLAEVDNRVAQLRETLAKRRRTSARIDELADYLRALAAKQPVTLTPLQALADAILDEARTGQPLRFHYAPPDDPSRFAAAHGLTVAQVLARLILDDTEWRSQAQLAIMAALVHDVGMTRVTAEILASEAPLDDDQRRLIEKHTVVAEEMLSPLWPGGGWPVEAATCHHERQDGTGYPLGKQDIHLAPFVKLLAVCDVYAALCTPRPHRAALDTRAALTDVLMLAERGYLHKPSAERLLLLSFYPVGSVVELNDGGAAVVIATHGGERGMMHPDRPIVHYLADTDGQATWPMVVDLLEHKERSIVRALRDEERASLVSQHSQLF